MTNQKCCKVCRISAGRMLNKAGSMPEETRAGSVPEENH